MTFVYFALGYLFIVLNIRVLTEMFLLKFKQKVPFYRQHLYINNNNYFNWICYTIPTLIITISKRNFYKNCSNIK